MESGKIYGDSAAGLKTHLQHTHSWAGTIIKLDEVCFESWLKIVTKSQNEHSMK